MFHNIRKTQYCCTIKIACAKSISYSENCTQVYITVSTQCLIFAMQLHEDLVQTADGVHVDRAVAVVCFLVQEGASLHVKDRRLRSPASHLAQDVVTLIKNYVKYQ